MKKGFILGLLLSSMIISAQGKVYNLDNKEIKKEFILTGDTAIYKGITYHVYKSKSGKLFIIVTSKSGKDYRKYLKND